MQIFTHKWTSLYVFFFLSFPSLLVHISLSSPSSFPSQLPKLTNNAKPTNPPPLTGPRDQGNENFQLFTYNHLLPIFCMGCIPSPPLAPRRYNQNTTSPSFKNKYKKNGSHKIPSQEYTSPRSGFLSNLKPSKPLPSTQAPKSENDFKKQIA